jgi:hypothetical protein
MTNFPINFPVLALCSLFPLIIGFLWYNDKSFGIAWLKARKLTDEDEPGIPVTLIVSYVYSFLIAFAIQMIETGLGGQWVHSFTHGAFLGGLIAVAIAIPVAGTNALHEGRGWKYLAINGGFWIICFALMGGVISQLS